MFKNHIKVSRKKALMFSGVLFFQVNSINCGCILPLVIDENIKLTREKLSSFANSVSDYINNESNYQGLVSENVGKFDVRISTLNRIKIFFNDKPFLVSEIIDSKSDQINIDGIRFSIILDGFCFDTRCKYTLKEIIESLTALKEEYRFNRNTHFLKIRDTSRCLMGGKAIYLDLYNLNMYNIDSGYLVLCSSRNLDKDDNVINYYTRTSNVGYRGGKYFLYYPNNGQYLEEKFSFSDIVDKEKFIFNRTILKSFLFVIPRKRKPVPSIY